MTKSPNACHQRESRPTPSRVRPAIGWGVRPAVLDVCDVAGHPMRAGSPIGPRIGCPIRCPTGSRSKAAKHIDAEQQWDVPARTVIDVIELVASNSCGSG